MPDTPPRLSSPPTPWLLISDVDDTLLGDDAATRRFAEAVADRDAVTVVYNSSRFLASILESIRTTDLPTPDAVIGGMGTQVQARSERLKGTDAAAGFDERSRTLVQPGWGDRVRDLLGEHDRVEVQPAANQSDLKASFYSPGASPALLQELEEMLGEAGLDFELTYSSDRDVDILPRGVNKASACRFVAETLGFDDDRVVVCGDSGNDRAMLTAGFQAVIVANHRPELTNLTGERIYRAKASHADGVIEGLAYWRSST